MWHGVKKEDSHREILEISESLKMANRADKTAELLFWKGVRTVFLIFYTDIPESNTSITIGLGEST